MLLVFKVKPKTNSVVSEMHTFTHVYMYTCPLKCVVNVYKFKQNMQLTEVM